MPSQTTTTPPLMVTALAALWVTSGRSLGESPWPGCDNGKVSLDTDLPKDAAHWDCPTSLWAQNQRLYSIDTVHDPEPANLICMDQPITYNHTIPNSGSFRAVSAESGEYLYCPPQRWLNNLYHGATVLLYHPCTPLQERLLLSALAQSCINEYVITPHRNLEKDRPIALVSWGRTLEVSTVASSEICNWLDTTSSTKNNAEELRHKSKYNLLLTRSAEQDRRQNSLEKNKGSLKQFCEQMISSLLNDMRKTQQSSSLKTGRSEHNKEREKRAAINHLQNEHNKDKTITNPLNISSNQTSSIINKPQSNITVSLQNPTLKDPSVSYISRTTTTKVSSVHQPSNVQLQTETVKPSDNKVEAEKVHSKESNAPARTVVSEHESVHSTRHRGRGSDKVVGKLNDNEVIDVEEREAGHKHSDPISQHKSESNGLDLASKSQPVSYVPNTGDCECKPNQLCDCTKGLGDKSQAAVVNQGLPRTPRTDEAVWAAGALGFLLALLTLSILHTRLYRHWRIGPSLYWRDPQQDYDSVADVIRRRLRLAKRRRKRGRKKEVVLLPSSSSSDEYP